MTFRVWLLALLLSVSVALGAADKKADLPVLGGTDEFGRIFLWQDGSKLFLTAPWERNVLGGGRVTGDKEPTYLLWGWTVEPPRVRFWTLSVIQGKPGKPGEFTPPQSVEFARDDFGVEGPDLAAKDGDHLALVYGALTPSPRWELWSSGAKRLAKAWDDGRTYSAVALSPDGDLALAARSASGRPFLETRDSAVEAPLGVLGRLATVAWNSLSEVPGWVATGWGAVDGRSPSLLARWNHDWVTTDTSVPPDPRTAGLLPAFASQTPAGDLLVASRQVLVNGGEQWWIWDPTGPRVPDAPDGALATAFASSGESGWVLVVRDRREVWSIVSDQGSVELTGLLAGDRVTLVSPPPEPAKQ